MDIVGLQLEFGGNLLSGKIGANEVQSRYPGAQRLMMPFQDRAGQIVKLASTRPVPIPLAMGLLRVKTALDNRGGITGRTMDTVGPPQVTNHILAPGFIDESLKIHEHLDRLTEGLGAILPHVAPPP